MITFSLLTFWLIIAIFGVSLITFIFYFIRTHKKILASDREIRKLKHDMGIKSVELLSRIEKLTEENQQLLDIQNKALHPSSIVEKLKDSL